MEEKVYYELDKLIDLLNKNDSIIRINELKKKLINNKDIIDKINKLKELDIYSSEYVSLKKELFNNEDFVSFKELENEINYLILNINKRLKELTNERRCSHENN